MASYEILTAEQIALLDGICPGAAQAGLGTAFDTVTTFLEDLGTAYMETRNWLVGAEGLIDLGQHTEGEAQVDTFLSDILGVIADYNLDDLGSILARIVAIENGAPGEGTIIEEITSALATLNTAETGLVDRTGALEEAVGDAEAGLVEDVATLQEEVETAESGLLDRVAVLEQSDLNPNAVSGPAPGYITLGKRLQLCVNSPTSVVFDASDAVATVLGVVGGPFVLTDGMTFIVAVNGAANQTVTFVEGTPATSTGDDDPLADMHEVTDRFFGVSVDGGPEVVVEIDTWALCDTETKTAAKVQAAIRDQVEGAEAMTFAFETDHYVATSAINGPTSAVVFTDAETGNCLDSLKMGVTNGGVEVPGTGDFADIGAATADEVVAAINDRMTDLTAMATGEGGVYILLMSLTAGAHSALAVDPTSTAAELLGFTGENNDAVGVSGFGLGVDMSNATFNVVATVSKDGECPVAGLPAIGAKATTGFSIYAGEELTEEWVEIIVFGVPEPNLN